MRLSQTSVTSNSGSEVPGEGPCAGVSCTCADGSGAGCTAASLPQAVRLSSIVSARKNVRICWMENIAAPSFTRIVALVSRLRKFRLVSWCKQKG